MSLQEQMIAANIRNWLTDLVIGAKAMSKIMQCRVSDEESAWKYEAKCWQQDDVVVDGVFTVYVFNVKELARAESSSNEQSLMYLPLAGQIVTTSSGLPLCCLLKLGLPDI